MTSIRISAVSLTVRWKCSTSCSWPATGRAWCTVRTVRARLATRWKASSSSSRSAPSEFFRISFLRSDCRGRVNAQISADSTHKNPAVRKIREVMRTAYAKRGIRSQHASNYTWGKRSRTAHEYCERKTRIVCEQHFSISLNRLMVVKVLLKCAIRLSVRFVATHFRIFVRQFLVHMIWTRVVFSKPALLQSV